MGSDGIVLGDGTLFYLPTHVRRGQCLGAGLCLVMEFDADVSSCDGCARDGGDDK